MSATLTIANHLAPGDRRATLERDVLVGLRSVPKSLPPTWFYDERGSRLFDEITRLPEYYLTRAERSILAAHANEIVVTAGASTLVELGSGMSEKTRMLLDAMERVGGLKSFVPFDVSAEVLHDAARDISATYGVDVTAVVGDFHRHLGAIPREGRRLVAFLGSTIGNLVPSARRRFLVDLDATMAFDDSLLLGTDLLKDRARLLAAYDDAAGLTATFNRNVLAVLNAELGADFDPRAFDHVAVWNEEERWIEMRLRSRTDQTIRVPALDLVVTFAAGEDLLTEISAKFTTDQIERELWEAGFVVEHTWVDPAGAFQLTLAHPYC